MPSSKSAARKAADKKRSAAKNSAKPSASVLSQQQEQDAYRSMLRIRRFEEKAGQLYGMGAIGGFCHLYIGQEAVIVGVNAVLQPDDALITAYRDHGHALIRGCSAEAVMAELTGRRDGISRGKGGSMHMFEPKSGFYGGHGIVGAQVSLGTGLGFAARYRDAKTISATFLGDGAINQGQVYESFNMAALWMLPVLYIVENNHYAMGTSLSRGSAQTELFRRGESFGIPGAVADGMDVQKTAAAAAAAADHCRSGKGPFLLELITYRYRGHSMSDPAKYRSREEVDKVRKEQDPIENSRLRLLASGVAEDWFRGIDQEIRAEIVTIVDFAQQSPEPDLAELFTDVVRVPA